jgi:hypothetical protein
VATPGFRIILAVIAASICSPAQWLHQLDPATPRTRHGKPNLTAPAPRVKGKPDLSGIWLTDSSPRKELEPYLLPGGENGLGENDITKYVVNFFADYKFGEEPFQPGAGDQFRKALQSNARPSTLCPPPSLPNWDYPPVPFKLIQTPGLLLWLREEFGTYRQIYIDGRKLPLDPEPTWQGYSAGHWEGDTLVVETTGFNAFSLLDAMGHPHSEAMRLTERFRRVDFGHMEVKITVYDPKTYTKPVTVTVSQHLLPDTDLIESFCEPGEKDRQHLGQ